MLPLFDFQVALVVKNPPANPGDVTDAWVRKIPWRRACQLTLVFLPGEVHGQRSLATGHEIAESDTTFTFTCFSWEFSQPSGLGLKFTTPGHPDPQFGCYITKILLTPFLKLEYNCFTMLC